MRASHRSDALRWTRHAAPARLFPVSRTLLAGMMLSLAACSAGCGSAPSPESAAPPRQSTLAPPNAVSSASDSVGAVPGSPDALFIYRFRQLEPPGSGTFAYRDRDLSFS